MILTCPACGTRYTVKDGAIPPGGRQVRCANCKHSWHQDPEPMAEEDAVVAAPIDEAEAAEQPAPAQTEYSSEQATAAAEEPAYDHSENADVEPTEDFGSSAATQPEEQSAEGSWQAPPSAEAEPQTITSEDAAALEDQTAEPLPYTMAQNPGLATPAMPAGEETGWVAQVPAEAVDPDFAAYDSGREEVDGGGRRLLIALLIALVVIAAAVAAFWFLAPSSFKERLGLAQVTDTPLKVQVFQRSRRVLASGQQVLEVSGRVINPSDQTQTVPPLQARLRSLNQQVVYRWTIAPPAPTLKPGTSAGFNSAELNIPESAACLDVYLDQPLKEPCRAEAAGQAG